MRAAPVTPFVVVLLLLRFVQPAAAQADADSARRVAVARLRPGMVVRVVAGADTTVGRFGAVTGDSLEIDTEGGMVARALVEIDGLAIRRRGGHRAAATGLAMGGVILGLFALAGRGTDEAGFAVYSGLRIALIPVAVGVAAETIQRSWQQIYPAPPPHSSSGRPNKS